MPLRTIMAQLHQREALQVVGGQPEFVYGLQRCVRVDLGINSHITVFKFTIAARQQYRKLTTKNELTPCLKWG